MVFFRLLKQFIMKATLALSVLIIAVLASFAHGCADNHKDCSSWARKGYCTNQKYVKYMRENCRKSCDLCGGGGGGGGSGSGECGYKPRARIVGGTEAPKGAWPWQAQIRYSSSSPFCGGTLVHSQWVVTAAHCVDDESASDLRVRLGAHYRKESGGSERLQDFYVSRLIYHREYQPKYDRSHDIALLKLDEPAQLNKYVNLACLPRSSESLSEIDGRRCWVTGFGRLESDGAKPDVLMQVSVPIISQEKCTNAYGSSKIHPTMVCAGYDRGGKDSCQGDSGGPLVCESGGKFFLEGVVSWGSGCARPGRPGVYARVRYLREWIDYYMRKYD